ncbi:MAG: hypothetical protein EBR01_10280, partial [Proteobacteria bacterium]|nr:hypothetical protein [Pseudomonadota bacterium]
MLAKFDLTNEPIANWAPVSFLAYGSGTSTNWGVAKASLSDGTFYISLNRLEGSAGAVTFSLSKHNASDFSLVAPPAEATNSYFKVGNILRISTSDIAQFAGTFNVLGKSLDAISSTDFSKLKVGQLVYGPGFPPNTLVSIQGLDSSNPSNLRAFVSVAPVLAADKKTNTLTVIPIMFNGLSVIGETIYLAGSYLDKALI